MANSVRSFRSRRRSSPPQARRSFLESSHAAPDVIEETLLIIDDFGSQAGAPDRIGTSAGRFVIIDYCGSGGVGDVYRANDPELDRAVALKFLRPSALEQAGAVERLISEARTVSALNHPNIVTVHEVLRSGSEVAIVMEFVEGLPLRVLCCSPPGLKQVVSIGRQIALALDAAHRRGIIHRDIKPENAILNRDGNIKVLDFGLATSLSVRRDMETAASASHLFAGTWRYMSPEQSRGEPVTAATDIYSLGLVLGELVTGRPLSDSNPSKTNLSDRIPRRLRSLIRSMLAEEPAQRPSALAVADGFYELESVLTVKSWRWPLRFLAAGIAASVCLLVVGGYKLFRERAAPAMLASPLSVEPGYRWNLSFSPNGDRLAYAWDREGAPRQIYVQSIDSATRKASLAARLTQGSTIEDLPAWSPDGTQLAFERGAPGQSYLVLHNVATGKERILSSFLGRSLAWTRDGKWLLASVGPYLHHPIALISPTTGEQHALTTSNGEANDDNPTPSPDNLSVTFARYFSDSVSRLATVPLKVNGAPFAKPVFLSWKQFDPPFSRSPVFSGDGRDLFFIARTGGIERIWRSHEHETPTLLASLGERVTALAVPLHRNRLAFLKNIDDTNIWKIGLKVPGQLDAGVTSRVVTTSRLDQRPALSPDGTQLAFESNRNGYAEIWIMKLSTGKTSQLTDFKKQCGSPSWSPDGAWIVFDGQVKTSSSLFKIRVDGGAAEQLTHNTDYSDNLPVFSPDGKWIYFASDRTGYYQIWRMPAAGGAASLQSDGEATAPNLSRDGRTLFYLEKFWQPSRLLAKNFSTGRITTVATNVFFRGYTIGRNSVYYAQPDRNRKLKLFTWSESDNRVRTVAALSSSVVGGFSLSPDEKTLYYAQLDSAGDELLMVEGY